MEFGWDGYVIRFWTFLDDMDPLVWILGAFMEDISSIFGNIFWATNLIRIGGT